VQWDFANLHIQQAFEEVLMTSPSICSHSFWGSEFDASHLGLNSAALHSHMSASPFFHIPLSFTKKLI
jgi:hypothetical protein